VQGWKYVFEAFRGKRGHKAFIGSWLVASGLLVLIVNGMLWHDSDLSLGFEVSGAGMFGLGFILMINSTGPGASAEK